MTEPRFKMYSVPSLAVEFPETKIVGATLAMSISIFHSRFWNVSLTVTGNSPLSVAVQWNRPLASIVAPSGDSPTKMNVEPASAGTAKRIVSPSRPVSVIGSVETHASVGVPDGSSMTSLASTK